MQVLDVISVPWWAWAVVWAVYGPFALVALVQLVLWTADLFKGSDSRRW